MPGENGGEPSTEGAFAFGLNLAFSELGPLQFFFFVEAPIVAGALLRGWRSAHCGPVSASTPRSRTSRRVLPSKQRQAALRKTGDLSIFEITLTVPDHTFRVGDEFRITGPDNSNYKTVGEDNFQVTKLDGDDISYLVTGNPGAFDGAKVKKITISDPLDLRDPGFVSTKDLSLSDWEAQLDAAVANQGSSSFWNRLTNPKVVIEGGATMSFDPRIPDNILGLDVDFLLDSELRLLLTGTTTLGRLRENTHEVLYRLECNRWWPCRLPVPAGYSGDSGHPRR